MPATIKSMFFPTPAQHPALLSALPPKMLRPYRNIRPFNPPKALTAGGLYNYALTKIDTPYVMFMKEQDTLEPAFISACLEALR